MIKKIAGSLGECFQTLVIEGARYTSYWTVVREEIRKMRPGKENRRDSQSRFVLEGNALYEIDEECMRRKARGRQPVWPKGRNGQDSFSFRKM